MKIIENELNIISNEILNDYFEPFEKNELKKFLFGSKKRIRSNFGLLFLKSFNFDLTKEAAIVFAVTEIIHNASLLHDDVIDDADIRRNSSSFSKVFSPKVSIIAGDFLLIFAINKLNSLNNFKVIQIFKNCTEQMCLAEIEQYYLRNKKTSLEEYLSICKRKTALLFSALLESLAELYNLDKNLAKKMAEYFGIVFQINNDLEVISEQQDKKNGIQTAKEILGVENTRALLDNYFNEIRLLLQELPNNKYKQCLEDLIRSYVK